MHTGTLFGQGGSDNNNGGGDPPGSSGGGGEGGETQPSSSLSSSSSGPSSSDIDTLLENSTCERFVLRCVENELPPNLIHCLRLLRVLELQHDHSVAAAEKQRTIEGGEYNGPILKPGPVSTRAAGKVSRLLCLLCSDSSVGEQLRPHLFGLLALSGASYPASGVHIASAASDVIQAFSAHCLSPSLVWFLHDRKMIVHMTDDIKELCAMTAALPSNATSSSSSNRCLYGRDAEEAGLWVVALRTVVYLVSNSCHYRCVELLKDYDGAGGYHVLSFAIANSNATHVKKLLELVTVLVCCKIASSSSSRRMAVQSRRVGGRRGRRRRE